MSEANLIDEIQMLRNELVELKKRCQQLEDQLASNQRELRARRTFGIIAKAIPR